MSNKILFNRNVNSESQELLVTEERLKDPVWFQILYLDQTPHKKQVEVLKSSHKNKIIVCGRRSGKTQMLAGEWIRGAITKEYPKQIIIAPLFKQSMIVFNKIVELMHHGGVYSDIKRVTRSPYPRIEFKGGSIIDFGSADNPDSLRGDFMAEL